MNGLEILALSPSLLEDYCGFFETTAHTDNPAWDRCYCVDYCGAANAGTDYDNESPQLRREHAVRFVKAGLIRGYLAYLEGKAVGWLNVNDRSACLQSSGWEQIMGSTPTQADRQKIKSVFCFTVAPALRGRGIAEALLRRAMEDAANQGYACMEAYPNKEETDVFYNYVGPMGLYKKLGFEPWGETENRLIFRKYFNWEHIL